MRFVPIVLLSGICALAQAQVTYTVTTTDDDFLATGSPTNPNGTDLTADNFGSAGVLVIAPASSPNGEYQSVLKFDVSGAAGLFDSTYGTNWLITGIALDFSCNFATQGAQPDNPIFNPINGGNFVIEWMADDDWVEGTGKPRGPTMDGVSYDSLPTLLAEPHEALCTNTYVPPGDNVHVAWPLPLSTSLVNDISAGGPVSFRLYAADAQISYLINSHNFGNGNQPLIHVTAIPLLKIFSSYFTNGGFQLSGVGGTNAPYQIQANTDLSTTNWQTIGTATADHSGAIQFDDTNPPAQGQRFYRFSQ